ncbi:hypothetical protein BDN72DRAFT_836197 [Pluteus cervinus]|uniref:Uncharacterized protein n=1 Tax=Pluteus cervinus TaxID=181527 RepID=A0ACD3B484_9AGAR|nr:hypothetical protein BDN72DRAFT_836197 [Pluteus cervinus]
MNLVEISCGADPRVKLEGLRPAYQPLCGGSLAGGWRESQVISSLLALNLTPPHKSGFKGGWGVKPHRYLHDGSRLLFRLMMGSSCTVQRRPQVHTSFQGPLSQRLIYGSLPGASISGPLVLVYLAGEGSIRYPRLTQFFPTLRPLLDVSLFEDGQSRADIVTIFSAPTFHSNILSSQCALKIGNTSLGV